MKYLITGATGAIGSAVVRQPAAEGKEVRAFVRDADKFHRLLPDVPAEVVTGDALNPDDVHRAARHREESVTNNDREAKPQWTTENCSLEPGTSSGNTSS